MTGDSCFHFVYRKGPWSRLGEELIHVADDALLDCEVEHIANRQGQLVLGDLFCGEAGADMTLADQAVFGQTHFLTDLSTDHAMRKIVL